MAFNHSSRRKNVIRSSVVSGICDATALLLAFGYRMVFLRVLTVEYLGIDGLFSSILGFLGLAELGVTNAIVYRLYKPISTDDTERTGHIMWFFRFVYLVIAAVILVLGLCLTPFLYALVKDASEVPADVSLRVVFVLSLLQTASTYLFSYKTALLTADQRAGQTTIINTMAIFARYTAQLVLLFATGNYTLTLAAGILATIGTNWLTSRWITRQYPLVFHVRENLGRADRHAIYRDTSAAMLHKVGGTILTFTDNILISKFVGLAVMGRYSNYDLVIRGADRVVRAIFNSFTPSLGNAHAELSAHDRYEVYRKAKFANFAIVGLFASCLYPLTDDFVRLWLGSDLLLDRTVLALICIVFYLEGVRRVSGAYTSACGLFVRDKPRPLIESAINVVVSIVALRRLGLAGVMVGTIVSCLLTVFWREPYLLYRYAFETSLLEYWRDYARHAAVTLLSCLCLRTTMVYLLGPAESLLVWVLYGLLGVGIYAVVFALAFHTDHLFVYYLELVRHALRRTHDAA